MYGVRIGSLSVCEVMSMSRRLGFTVQKSSNRPAVPAKQGRVVNWRTHSANLIFWKFFPFPLFILIVILFLIFFQ